VRFKTDSTKQRLGFTAIWHQVLKCEWTCLQCMCSWFYVVWEHRLLGILNNYSPKAKWLPVNIHRDEVEVNIHCNHWAWGE
jgi:hypothetical protein